MSKEGVYEIVPCGKGFRAQVTNGMATKFAYGRTKEEAIRRFAYRAEWVIETQGKKFFGRSHDEALLSMRAASDPLIQSPTAWARAVISNRSRKPQIERHMELLFEAYGRVDRDGILWLSLDPHELTDPEIFGDGLAR